MIAPAPSLITLSPPTRSLDRALLDRPGAFAWWYVDLVNDRGDGAVIIWSWGLPFLPGIASSARRDRPVVPRSRPSLNVALYKDHKLDAYMLREFAPEACQWHACDHRWSFEDNTMAIEREGDRVRLTIDLDSAIPGTHERWRGRIEAHGVARRAVSEDQRRGVDEHHDWSPVMIGATAHVDVCAAGVRYAFEARAYHDRNGGVAPLHDLGFERWIWGRLPRADGGESIYYILWPRGGGEPTSLGLEIDAEGHTTRLDDLELRTSRTRRTMAGMRWSRSWEIWHEGALWQRVKAHSIVDNGPFYLRFFIHATNAHGASTWGIGESCEPDRVDMMRHRPLVSMRVQQPSDARDSMWLPLFTGPRSGRLGRLVRHVRRESP